MTTMEQVAQILAAHRQRPKYEDGYFITSYGCTCEDYTGNSDDEHDAHVAQVLDWAGLLVEGES